MSFPLTLSCRSTPATPADDGQPDLPSGGHTELPGGGQRDYLV
jgi:hypothetical protein